MSNQSLRRDENNQLGVYLGSNPTPQFQVVETSDMQAAISTSEVKTAFLALAFGSLGSTSGSVIGETRTISGGTDDGMRIVWAVPASGGGATWCYWIWPQEAYAA
jgi:hypothetical protein